METATMNRVAWGTELRDRMDRRAAIQVSPQDGQFHVCMEGVGRQFATLKELKRHLAKQPIDTYYVDDHTRDATYYWHREEGHLATLTQSQLQRRLSRETGGAWIEKEGTDLRYVLDRSGWFIARYDCVDELTFVNHLQSQKPGWLSSLIALMGVSGLWKGVSTSPSTLANLGAFLVPCTFSAAAAADVYGGPVVPLPVEAIGNSIHFAPAVDGFLHYNIGYPNATVQYFNPDFSLGVQHIFPVDNNVILRDFNGTHSVITAHNRTADEFLLWPIGDPGVVPENPKRIPVDPSIGSVLNGWLHALGDKAMLCLRSTGNPSHAQELTLDFEPMGALRPLDPRLSCTGLFGRRTDGFIFWGSNEAIYLDANWTAQGSAPGPAKATTGSILGAFVNGLDYSHTSSNTIALSRYSNDNNTGLISTSTFPISSGRILQRSDGTFLSISGTQGQHYSSIWELIGSQFTAWPVGGSSSMLFDLPHDDFGLQWTNYAGVPVARRFSNDSSLTLYPPNWKFADHVIEAEGFSDEDPDVAPLPNWKEYGVVWRRVPSDGSPTKVMWKEFHVVNGPKEETQEVSDFNYDPECPVAVGTDTGAQLFWVEYGRDGNGKGVVGAERNAAGTIEPSKQINDVYEYDQTSAQAHYLGGGRTAVAYSDYRRSALRIVNASLGPLGPSETIGESTSSGPASGDRVRAMSGTPRGFAVGRQHSSCYIDSCSHTQKIQLFSNSGVKDGPDRVPVSGSTWILRDMAQHAEGLALLLQPSSLELPEIHILNADGLRVFEPVVVNATGINSDSQYSLLSNGTHLQAVWSAPMELGDGMAVHSLVVNLTGNVVDQGVFDGFVPSFGGCRLVRSTLLEDGTEIQVWSRRLAGSQGSQIAIRVNPGTGSTTAPTPNSPSTPIQATTSDGSYSTRYLGWMAAAALGLRVVA